MTSSNIISKWQNHTEILFDKLFFFGKFTPTTQIIVLPYIGQTFFVFNISCAILCNLVTILILILRIFVCILYISREGTHTSVEEDGALFVTGVVLCQWSYRPFLAVLRLYISASMYYDSISFVILVLIDLCGCVLKKKMLDISLFSYLYHILCDRFWTFNVLLWQKGWISVDLTDTLTQE